MKGRRTTVISASSLSSTRQKWSRSVRELGYEGQDSNWERRETESEHSEREVDDGRIFVTYQDRSHRS